MADMDTTDECILLADFPNIITTKTLHVWQWEEFLPTPPSLTDHMEPPVVRTLDNTFLSNKHMNFSYTDNSDFSDTVLPPMMATNHPNTAIQATPAATVASEPWYDQSWADLLYLAVPHISHEEQAEQMATTNDPESLPQLPRWRHYSWTNQRRRHFHHFKSIFIFIDTDTNMYYMYALTEECA